MNTKFQDIEDLSGIRHRRPTAIKENRNNKNRVKVISDKERANMMKVLTLLDNEEDLSDPDDFTTIFAKLCRRNRVFHLSKFEFRALFQKMILDGDIEWREDIENGLIKKGGKSKSGIVSVTVFTDSNPDGQEFSCKHNCYFCPNQPNMPRSYLSDEPGCLRATRCNFHSIAQTWERLSSLKANGHNIEKVELLVLGGTWTEYPQAYQERFIRDLFYAANTFQHCPPNFQGGNTVLMNQILADIRPPLSLEEEQDRNPDASAKIIGLTLETRPDTINEENIRLFKKYGCTRIQLGIQTLDNKILKKINRGHTAEDAYAAMQLLLDSGYKVDIHLMPDLPGSSVENDRLLFDTLLQKDLVPSYVPNMILGVLVITMMTIASLTIKIAHPKIGLPSLPTHGVIIGILVCLIIVLSRFGRSSNHVKYKVFDDLQADQWKIYPCTVTHWTVIERWYKSGKYIPYAELNGGEDLTNLLLYAKKKVFPWIRLNRVVRDIPHKGSNGERIILDKDRCTNLRQVLQVRMKNEGWSCQCIRCREVGLNQNYVKASRSQVDLRIREYNASKGTEYFISFESTDNYLHGFCRLRITENSGANIFLTLENTALIRELHVYGKLQTTQSDKINMSQQHQGYGKRMLSKAEMIAIDHGYTRIAVIAGIGTRNYYAKLGYVLDQESKHMIKIL